MACLRMKRLDSGMMEAIRRDHRTNLYQLTHRQIDCLQATNEGLYNHISVRITDAPFDIMEFEAGSSLFHFHLIFISLTKLPQATILLTLP